MLPNVFKNPVVAVSSLLSIFCGALLADAESIDSEVSAYVAKAEVANTAKRSSLASNTSANGSGKDNANQGLMNPSSRCSLEDCFEITGAFLWWKAEQPDLPYAFVNTNSANQNSGYVDYIDFKWRPGFRLGIGWDTDYDGWNLNANWTWFRNHSESNVHAVTTPEATGFNLLVDSRGVHAPQQFAFTNDSTHVVDPTDISFALAKASWTMQLNMIDLQLGKSYLVSPKIALGPFIGVRGGWITRHLAQLYDVTPYADALLKQRLETSYWGVGPRLGLDSDWKLGAGFELFGNMATSLLFGESYDESTKAEFDIASTGEIISTAPFFDVSRKSSKTRVVPTLQMILGLGWNKCFNDNKCFVDLRAGWEVNYFWQLQNFLNIFGNQAKYTFPSNLDLSGLTLSARFGF